MESPFYEMSQEFFDDANRQFKNGYARGYSDALLKAKERSEMTDKDKVIKGLIHCTAWAGLHECQPKVGDDCPYEDESDCKLTIMEDALAVIKEQKEEIKRLKLELKEQEPRILDWDEIRNYPVVYGEFRGIKEIYPLIITVNNWGQCLSWNPGINVSDEFLLVVSDEEDRKNTRCWNKMPTDEQRQAVKWE